MNTPALETEHLILRKFTEKDIRSEERRVGKECRL